MTWTAALGTEECGACHGKFLVNAPIALFTSKGLRRCAPCVAPIPVDQAAVDAVIAERESERQRQIVGQVTKPGKAFAPMLPLSSVADAGLNTLLRDTGGIKGIRPTKSPKPFSKVANDPAVRRSQGAER
jgi:hypothetical protein